MKIQVCKILLLLCLAIAAASTTCGKQEVQVVVAFHPHLDAFWLNTEEQLRNINFVPMPFLYQMNQRNSKSIFNSMYDALTAKNATVARRYFVSEVFFIKDWYDYIEPAKKAVFKELLTSGKLEMVNLGWVENDEAICYYDDIIEQYTVGMNWLYEQFGYVGRVGWATDCFGHSHSQAALLNELGMQMQGIERFDERYTHLRKDGPLLQYYWATRSDSNNITYGGLMTHVRYFNHEPADYLRRIEGQGVAGELNQMIPHMKKLYGKNLLFKFYGNDFEEFITKEFENVEAGLKVANSKDKCNNYHYGNPSEYMELLQKHFKENKLQSRYFDLMPDYDAGRYWSGYFTTDPLLKKVCKDYSRLLNFYKKSLIQGYAVGRINLKEQLPRLQSMEELLAIMQHHDGITATSKHAIEVQMINKMNASRAIIVQNFKKQHDVEDYFTCDVFANNNECEIDNAIVGAFHLKLYSFGTVRKERVEIVLPNGKYWRLVGDDYWEIYCYKDNYQSCRIVVQVPIHPNNITLFFTLIDLESIKPYIIVPTAVQDGEYGNSTFKLVGGEVFRYDFGGHFYQVSYVHSAASGYMRDSTNWTKFGQRIDGKDMVRSGFYIMENDGILANTGTITQMKVMMGEFYAKIFLMFNVQIEVVITLEKDLPNVLDIATIFTPPSSALADYFLRVQSDVKGNNDFYHDANGYLVMRRVFDQRPDYEMKPVLGDKINANTYPTTSFAYIKNDQHKMLVSLDRAEGVAIYDQDSLLMNIDRLTTDDGKGAAEGYGYIIKNVFRHKIAITQANDDLERQWQKHYDEPIFGAYAMTLTNNVEPPKLDPVVETLTSKYIKVTTAVLNDHAIVVRFQNLAQFTEMSVDAFLNGRLVLPDFNIHLPFKDAKESFHNGIPLGQRYNWFNLTGTQVVDIHKNEWKGRQFTLKPLQIRSFRIDFTTEIPAAPQPTPNSGAKPVNPAMSSMDLSNAQKLSVKHLRCF